MMTTLDTDNVVSEAVGPLAIVPLLHPQGCRTYLVADRDSKQAIAVDVHLDLVEEVLARAEQQGWSLTHVVDTHTHADHPSGSAALSARTSCTRVAHELSQHEGVSHHPQDGETLALGQAAVTVRHAPGHTPDHIMLLVDGAVFAGDTLLIGGVARTDFLGGDAGELFDSIHGILDELPDATIVYPGHDYQGRVRTTLGDERSSNAWLRMNDRDDFVRQLVANPPPRPANMDDLLRLNREGIEIPAVITAQEAVRLVENGGATSVIDVRTGIEFDGEHIAGSRPIPLDQIAQRTDEIRSTPAPRLLLCRSDQRARMARETLGKHDIGGLTVIEGGIEAYRAAGGATERGKSVMSLERQVRIAAGALVLTGVLTGLLVHPAMFGLSAFVGAGLMFAGITDWCGMGLLLAKAPWNRSKKAASGGPVAACAASAPTGGCSAPAPTGGCSAPAPEPKG